MKKILIVAYNLHIGGIQKSLLNLLNYLCNDYDITIFLFSNKGEYLSEIPKSIKVLFPNKKYFVIGMSQKELFKESFLLFLKRLALKIKIVFFGREKTLIKFLKKCIIPGEFDACISFQQNGPGKSMLFGANYCSLSVESKIKMAFLHSDFEKAGTLTKYNIDEYNKFDYVFSVSETGKNTLCKYLDESRIRVCKNLHNIENIIDFAQQYSINKLDVCTFVTVSRISEEKGINRIISVAKRLNNSGMQFAWRIIGDGPLLSRYKKVVKREHVLNVFFEGATKNPYPYILSSDYLVITSRHEASPMVVQEAQILGTSVLAVNYSSAKEFINADSVCENDDISLYDILFKAISLYPKTQKSFSSDYTNKSNRQNAKELVEVLESL